MSIFSPLDPRGPDQRRKQLIAKLAQQAGAAHSAAARVPMPGRLSGGPLMSEGRSFHGAGDARGGGGRANVTQSPNILQSVLARLGVVGKSHGEEMSGGHGLPIAPPAPSQGAPIPPQGAAIPTPGQIAPPPGTQIDPSGTGNPFTGGAPGGTTSTDPEHNAFVHGQSDVDPFGVTSGAGGPVPLGNGLYFDPATGTILGQQDVLGPSAAARNLGRTAG